MNPCHSGARSVTGATQDTIHSCVPIVHQSAILRAGEMPRPARVPRFANERRNHKRNTARGGGIFGEAANRKTAGPHSATPLIPSTELW